MTRKKSPETESRHQLSDTKIAPGIVDTPGGAQPRTPASAHDLATVRHPRAAHAGAACASKVESRLEKVYGRKILKKTSERRWKRSHISHAGDFERGTRKRGRRRATGTAHPAAASTRACVGRYIYIYLWIYIFGRIPKDADESPGVPGSRE